MLKLNIKIKANDFEEIKKFTEVIKTLELEKTPELNTEIAIEFGYED